MLALQMQDMVSYATLWGYYNERVIHDIITGGKAHNYFLCSKKSLNFSNFIKLIENRLNLRRKPLDFLLFFIGQN